MGYNVLNNFDLRLDMTILTPTDSRIGTSHGCEEQTSNFHQKNGEVEHSLHKMKISQKRTWHIMQAILIPSPGVPPYFMSSAN